MTGTSTLAISTLAGPARAELDRAAAPRFLLVLTHGAGGGIDAPDLIAARDAGSELGGTVARVLQPYRLRGARAPGSALRQDAAWLEAISALRAAVPGVPLIQGGRSNGARVACRTATAAGAAAVVALAFPLHPPSRRPGHHDQSRAEELRAAGTPVLVVNGDRDPFGVPDQADAGEGATVLVLSGQAHALSRDPGAVHRAVRSWLAGILPRVGG